MCWKGPWTWSLETLVPGPALLPWTQPCVLNDHLSNILILQLSKLKLSPGSLVVEPELEARWLNYLIALIHMISLTYWALI